MEARTPPTSYPCWRPPGHGGTSPNSPASHGTQHPAPATPSVHPTGIRNQCASAGWSVRGIGRGAPVKPASRCTASHICAQSSQRARARACACAACKHPNRNRTTMTAAARKTQAKSKSLFQLFPSKPLRTLHTDASGLAVPQPAHGECLRQIRTRDSRFQAPCLTPLDYSTATNCAMETISESYSESIPGSSPQ